MSATTPRHRAQMIILSVSKAEQYIAGPDDVCISIRSPDADDARLSPNFRDVLRIRFHDLAFCEPPYPDGAVQLSEEDAERIAAFALKHRDAKRFVVHCEAGISRSVAVALAISSTLYGFWCWPTWYQAKDRGDRWIQNRRVFDMVCAALRRAERAP